MVRPGSRMEVAEAVLSVLRVLCPEDLDLAYQAYSNGREQGYHITGPHSRHVSFSEYRNTDDIVIYYGVTGEFDMAGNIPNEKVYKKQQKGFPYSRFVEAASFVIDWMNS